VYNIGSGESHAIQEVLDALLSMSEASIEVRQDPKRMRPSDAPEIRCDSTRIREQTGWETTIGFEQSLEDILEYWRKETKQQEVPRTLPGDA
jgi:GDP-4-dehydro-6-deoxy-D-mannose reductase